MPHDVDTYESILESSAEGIIIIQEEMIVFHNKAALEISGYPSEIYKKTPINKIIHPDDVPRIMDYHYKRVAGEPISPFIEGKFITYSGKERWMQVNSSLVEWNGKPAIVSFISDITDRKYAEAKFSAAFQAAGSALTISDMETRKFEHINDQFVSLTGFLPSEAIGKSGVEIGLFAEEIVCELRNKLKEQGAIKDFEITITRRDGTTRDCLYSGEVVTFGGKQSLVSVAIDITERKKQQEKIRTLALTDSLTGLSNRSYFNDKFDDYVKIAKREGQNLALMLIDLDKFKFVNDTYGHQVGDAVLIEVAKILKTDRREVDIVARLGGDEFAILLFSTRNQRDVEDIANSIIHKISTPFQLDGNEIQIGASIGVAFFPEQGDTQDVVFQNADTALYKSKNSGRNRVTFS